MLASMREVEETHWWFVARRTLIIAVIERNLPDHATSLLDVGCGTGANLEAITRHFPELTTVGLDADSFCLEACSERGLSVRSAAAEQLPVSDGSQDVVTAFDVLEHVENEVSMLREMVRALRPGGLAVVTVPAYQWLWGPHDTLTHHHRRYTRARLVRAIRAVGLETAYATYFNTLLFPPAAVARLVARATGRAGDDQTVPWGPVNTTLRAVFASERLALGHSVPLPWGLSVLAVARKPG